MNIVDRRNNPHGKSLANRQRFIERAKEAARHVVNEALKRRRVSDISSGETIKIPIKSIAEPSFHHANKGGIRDYVLPGNRSYIPGDRILRPKQNGDGNNRPQANHKGEGLDSFEFALTYEEFLNILFEDMELPDLIKTALAKTETSQLLRAGYAITGTSANINIRRTVRQSLARRIALNRPSRTELDEAECELNCAIAANDHARIEKAQTILTNLRNRKKHIVYIDPNDLRYNLYQRAPRPTTQAVMICLMDVSGSMTEHMKDLAKRFFLLLHVFLTKSYQLVEIVFIRHTSIAQEVDEDVFFYGRETGGTVVSSVLEKFVDIVKERYSVDSWNIYAAQASDGDNVNDDNPHCLELLTRKILPITQHFSYIEVSDSVIGRIGIGGASTSLWRTYSGIREQYGNFAMKKVSEPGHIYPVFYELFSREKKSA